MSEAMRPVSFQALFNSQERGRLPEGAVWSGKDFTLVNGVVEGGPRYGELWQRSGAHAGDFGLGMAYAEFGSAQEFLVVVQHNSEAFSRLYTVNPATGTYTQVTNGGGPDNPQNMVAGGRWFFAQYLDWVYAVHDGASGKMFRHRVGTNGVAEAWQAWNPVFNRGAGTKVEVTAEPLPNVSVKAIAAFGDTTLPPEVTVRLSQTGLFEVVKAAGGASVMNFPLWVVIDLADPVEHSFIDRYRIVYTDHPAISLNTSAFEQSNALLVSDGDSTPSVAWCRERLPSMAILSDPKTLTGTQKERCGRVPTNLSGFRSDPAHERNRGVARRLVLRLEMAWTTAAGTFVCNSFTLGHYRWSIASFFNPAWAYRFVREGTTEEATGMVFIQEVAQARGVGLVVGNTGNLSMGTSVDVFGPFDGRKRDEGYRTIEFLRRDSITGDKWFPIGRAPNEPGKTVYRDSWSQAVVNANSSSIAFAPGANGPPPASRIATWRGHAVLGHDRRLFFSTQGLPGEFVPSVEDLAGDYSDALETLGRTLYVSTDRSESALFLLGGGDVLWVGTRREVLVMVGDSAQEATQPRPVGERGAMGPYGATLWNRGVVVAHRDGLYYYRVSRADVSDVGGALDVQELTAAVRDSWQRFLGGQDGSAVVVREHDGEIWCFHAFGSTAVEQRYMRLTKPVVTAEGPRAPVWEEGLFAPVTDAVSTARHGLRALLGNGTMRRVGFNAAGSAYTTNDGSPVTWEVETGDLPVAREQVIGALFDAVGNPVVTLTVWDGLRDSVGTSFALTRSANQDWATGVNIPPHTRRRVKVAGTVGVDKLRGLWLKVQPRTEGYGN